MKAAVQILSSSSNALLKDVRRAASRGVLTNDGYAVAEGRHLFDEAKASNIEVGAVLISEELEEELDSPTNATVYRLSRSLFREVATTESPQGIITLVRLRDSGVDFVLDRRKPVLLLDGLQDPGNAGAIVRAAEAFGAGGVVFLKNTVSPYNPKCLRAAAGSLFRVPFTNHPAPEDVREAIALHGVDLYAAMPEAKVAIDAVEWSKSAAVAIVIGGEGGGVSSAWAAEATHVRIPTTGVESLNAAVAAAVILYEARKQRRES
ncbi:MAG TPA: RNA methyltransferase [Bryobacteraceae bacterium]|jgi:TrmH family RNA methyltransferase